MLKSFLKNIIYKLIEIIEKIEYRNNKFDENDPLKKIINFLPVEDLLVETDYGFVPIDEINLTQPYKIHEVELENGLKIDCANVHAIFCEGHIIKYIQDLTLNDVILTKKGPSKVKSINKLKNKVSMFDLSIMTNEHSYYANDILSLNTVSASIVILHLVLFNHDKGVMVVANKFDTVKEIIRKIKDIYLSLPFFLKSGVTNWNERTIAFENNSRIQCQARSKEPAIGFAIDLLYLDEFAKVPDKMIRQYYGSVVPTVSAIENSKIIITSTPEGYNLFWELITDAERPKEDPRWNKYEPMRVYWYQVKGRRDTKMLFLDAKLRQYNITVDEILDSLRELGYEIYSKKLENDIWYFIKFFGSDEKTPRENCEISHIRTLRIKDIIPLPDLCRITNWQEEQTAIIGGKNMFEQEFEIRFITDDKLLFDSVMFENFANELIEFETPPMEIFEKRINLPYTSLKFIKDRPDLFELSKAKDYHIAIGVDLAEGLGLDYSVFNIFRLMMKDEGMIERKKHMLTNKYDLFKLEQIGMFRCNVFSMNEMAHFLYLIAFELFDPEKVKIVVEMNKNLGNDLINNLRHVFNDNNDFMDAIFARYKHRETDKKTKTGLLIGTNKKLYLKDFQVAVKKDNLILHNDINIIELKSFSKKETSSGEITFRSETGNDDCVMSLVNLSSIFDNVAYKDMVDNFSDFHLTEDQRRIMMEFLGQLDDGDITNYANVTSAHKKFYPKMKPEMRQALIPPSPFTERPGIYKNPFERKYF